MDATDLSSVISEINEDILKEIDPNPTIKIDEVINNGEKVFDNSSVFEKLDKLRKEITAESVSSTGGFGLSGKTTRKEPEVEIIEPPKTTNPYNTTSSSQSNSGYNPYNPYRPGTQTTNTQQQKTRAEKVVEYTNKILDGVAKQVTTKVDKEYANITEKKSNWTIFDLQEEKLHKEMHMTEKEKKKQNKKSLFSDKTKISMLESVTMAGHTLLTMLLLDNKKGDK